jgi:cytochrome c oxidase subunit 3
MSDISVHYSTTGQPHPFHIVRPSPWPIVTAFSAGTTAFGAVTYFHDKIWWPLAIGLFCLFFFAGMWFRDIIREANVTKEHTPTVRKGFRYGMLLFIASEVSFFGAFFAAYFNSALAPTEALGFMWPPKSIQTVNPFDLPFLMTIILLLSGCTVTWAHSALIAGNRKDTIRGLALTVFLGMMFTSFQAWEYFHAEFGFKETVYASTFYMATGFHGFHVIIGTIFLAVCLWREYKGQFAPNDHFGFEAAAWYWHFVDVVWLFLFVAIYWFGSN